MLRRGKYAQEQVAVTLAKELGIPHCALRYTICHGPRQSKYNPYTGHACFGVRSMCVFFGSTAIRNCKCIHRQMDTVPPG